MRRSPLIRALVLVWRICPGWTAASLLLLAVAGVLPLLTLYLMKLTVDAVVAGAGAADKAEALVQVGWLVGAVGAAAVAGAICRAASGVVNDWQTHLMGDHVHQALQSQSVRVDLEYYENPQYHDTLHRAQQEGANRPVRIMQGFAVVGQSALSLLAVIGLLAGFHWALALVLFAGTLPDVWLRIRHSDRLFRWQRGRTPMEREAGYYSEMLTDDGHAKEVRLLGLGPLFIERFRGLRNILRGERMALSAKRNAAELGVQTLGLALLYGTYAWLAFQAVRAEITLGDLVMFEQAFSRGQGFLREMLAGIAGLYENNLFLSNFYDFLDLEPKLAAPAEPLPVPRPMASGFRFEGVGFRYGSDSRQTLAGIDLALRPGEVVALVGENGSGKTTLVKLLCRLYDPTEGRITLDGTDLRRFAPDDLRGQISVIFQDYVHYHLTAADNIRFGNPVLPPGDPRIAAAARDSGADEVISRLSKGYETILGRRFAGGEELSIGQWQKVALARAFLRDAQVIVMDEPTAAMDAKAEAEVFDNFRRLAAGRAALLISHRLSTVKSADRIYVLEQGRIVESGRHDGLMAAGGLYARLFELQARNYR